MTDPITDMLNIIKNGQAVFKEKVSVPFSLTKQKIAEILKDGRFIADIKKRGRSPKKLLVISLKYNPDKTPALHGFKRVSKPGRRVYRKAKELKRIKNGFGLAVVSTPRGIVSAEQARKKKTGGELLLEIW